MFWAGILASLIGGSVAMVLRLRRSRGIERLQSMWLAWSAVLIPLALLFCGLSAWVFGDSLIDWIVFPLILLFQVAVATSVGIAVTRYRLYAIERIVNRTAVYASLTLVLVAAYVVITVGFGVFVGGGSTWVVALATLAVAVAFRPLRARIQDLVDRRYRRARYAGVRLVRAFEDEVRDGLRAPEEIGAVVAEAIGDPLAELFFWLPETEAYADARGDVPRALPRDERAEREIRRDDARTAVLLYDPSLRERRDLLDGVLGAAALSIEMARLRVEVRLQLAEVEASRVRIVEAGYEERRRLERDLHDGAQQRLVSLGSSCDASSSLCPAVRSCSRPRSIRRSSRSERRSPTSARSRPASGPRGSTMAWRPRSATSRVPRRFRSRSRRHGSAWRRVSRQPRTSSPARRSRMPSSTARLRRWRFGPSGRTGPCT